MGKDVVGGLLFFGMGVCGAGADGKAMVWPAWQFLAIRQGIAVLTAEVAIGGPGGLGSSGEAVVVGVAESGSVVWVDSCAYERSSASSPAVVAAVWAEARVSPAVAVPEAPRRTVSSLLAASEVGSLVLSCREREMVAGALAVLWTVVSRGWLGTDSLGLQSSRDVGEGAGARGSPGLGGLTGVILASGTDGKAVAPERRPAERVALAEAWVHGPDGGSTL